MKKLFVVLVAMMFLASFAFAQTDATVNQTGSSAGSTGKVNFLDLNQSDGGPSNVNGLTETTIDQTAGTYNEATIDQLGRKSDIDLDQTAGSSNVATISQLGNYDNHFDIDQNASGSNTVDVYLGQPGGGDIHGNDYEVDQTAAEVTQTATGNNDLTISSRGNHVYGNSVSINQTATDGNNLANINMDGDWTRTVRVNADQSSMDNDLQGMIRGESIRVDIDQNADLGTNYASFEAHAPGGGTRVDLDVDQSSLTGSNSLTSYQEGNAGATVNQTATLGSNSAVVNQIVH